MRDRRAELAGVGLTLLGCTREPGFVRAPAVLLGPFRGTVVAEPLRGDDRQAVQGMPKRFGRTPETVGGADAGQHMGRVGALSSPGLEQPQALAAIQQPLEQQPLHAAVE